ncbi:MAG TPA: protein-disulfide reductase DsbD N-terminal domain-containing protein [Pyrinomonadaceae bacterium]|nr:protein-disulfide reductase DsbD N-terminal domain-containing protein [Pyrinomonadaceae bacterium]HMP65375.1 protein-disulfide reductase DsbD N-terminal domain-containing protein [Pyrinomonadaceae bacterium]
MKNAIYCVAIFLGISLFAGAETSHGQTASGSIGNGTVARGGSARGTVVLSIPAGLHVNSNRPNSEYAIPTTVRLTATGVRVTGVTYPRGRNKRFQFSPDTINVYEGRVTFPFTVRVPANFRGNTITVRAAVRYQACTDEVCYPPRTQNVTMTARVR